MSPEEARDLRHELRTPVNHLIGYAELLLEEEGVTPLAVEQLEGIRSLSRQVLTLLPQILAEDGTIDERVRLLGERAQEMQSVASSLQRLPGQLPAADLDRIVSAANRLAELAARIATGNVAVERAPGSVQSPREGSSETVLVVDDDEANRDVLGRRLQRLGYGVIEARDGIEALERLADGGIDLVLLDVMMPRLDGFGVLERCHEDPFFRHIPIIMISALDEMESIVRCVELGAEDYLPKPFDPVLLKARIGACLEKKRLRDQEKTLLATVTEQAAELRSLNTDLERRVAEKVREVERLSLMERFVPPELFEAIARGSTEFLKSHRSEITVLFADLRGFTPFSESSEPEDVMAVLSSLHDAVGPLIFEHGGTLAQFTGDGMMVLFNDPLPCEEPAWRAVQLALAMQERTEALTAQWLQKGHSLGMGMGIAMGYATCGQIGFEGRYEYTAIGTVTNVASRLCAVAAGGQVLVSPRVQDAVAGRARLTSLGPLDFKGLRAPIETFSVERL